MPRLAKYKYTGLTGPLRDLLREAPTRGYPDKVTKDWLRSVYGVSSNGESIISVLRFVGLIRQHDGSPTDLWDAISRPTPENKIRFADAVRKAYYDLFRHYPDAHRQNDDALRTFFERQVESGPEARRHMVSTFKTLLLFGDFDTVSGPLGSTPLPELVQSVEALDTTAREWLQRHIEVQARLKALGPLHKRLNDLSLEQDGLLRDGLRAAEADLFRASHTLAWGGLVDFLYKPFTVDAVNNKRPKWKLESLEELYAKPDSQLIDVGKELGYYSESIRRILQGLLTDRNRCSHGSGYDPVLADVQGFLSKIFHVITDLKTKYPRHYQ
jgi:hypothetical protein